MDETKTSLLMKFEQGGEPIAAECPIVISVDDTLAGQIVVVPAVDPLVVPGFAPSKPSSTLSKYFLVSNFNFNATLSDGESKAAAAGGKGTVAAAKPPAAGAAGARDTGHRHAAGGLGLGHRDDPAKAGAGAEASASSFQRWRSATDDSWKNDGSYTTSIQEFSFVRLIDQATPLLFRACCEGTSFRSATLIKRKPALHALGDDLIDLTYLRIDFAGVKITALDWSDGDVVEETCKFICDAMQVSYWTQSPDGSLTPNKPANWKNPMSDAKNRQS